MKERETSGAPQSKSSATNAPGVVPGGSFRTDTISPTTLPAPPKPCGLQALITLIRKKSDQPNSSLPRE